MKLRSLLESFNSNDIDIKHWNYTIVPEGMFDGVYFDNPFPNAPELNYAFKKSALRFRQKRYPDINDGDTVLELHIDLHPKLQRKGIALQMIRAFLWREGGTFWISHGRIINPNVYKLIDKMAKILSVVEYDDGFTVSE